MSERPADPAAPFDLARLIRAGDCIAWNGAGGEPTHLMALLNEALPQLPACTGFANVGLTATLDPERVRGRLRVKALGGAGTNRRFQDVGALDVISVHYSAIPDLVRSGVIAIDVVLTSLAADGHAFNTGVQVDYISDALPGARVVIGEVNAQAPVTFGDTAVAREHVDYVLHVSRPLVEMPPTRPDDIARAIGANVARLVPDGATVQTGLGVLPDAVLEALSSKKDLGVHSGTIGDRVMDLMEAGVITNRRKTIDTGVTVTAGMLGSNRLYRFAHRNPAMVLRSPRYTHDNLVHAGIDGLIGINSSLEIDLTGQMNAEVAGGRNIGMVGGHADFMRGCLRAKGGRGIIVLESTARGGKVSRIVPKLADAVVTTSRSDADVVVTEYGVAELRGRSASERAAALIAIAHPQFRDRLRAAADGLV